MPIFRGLLTLVICLLFVPCAFGEEDNLLDHVIMVGGDHNYPPYEFIDENGQPAGFNVELTRAIANVMGMDLEIRLGPWGEMRQGLASGKIDILQGMAYSQERTHEVDFSTPHAKVHQSIWVRKGSTITTLEDLAHKDVIVMRGAVMHDFILSHPELNARVHPVETLGNALQTLSAGSYDAALVAKLPGEYLIQKTGLANIRPI
ncbi:MAG: transporter substrate-binding domain-containing protein, partial [Geopsychrobacter sp.]|nr:transporter substrate-binding domain-containing protein [Geopsychrobacter sp.]